MAAVSIRPMRETDISAAMRLKDAEGWNQTEADWRFFLNHNPELCLVAVVAARVIGTVTAINYRNEVAWIGMMLVAREQRGQGISKKLLQSILDKLGDCTSVKLDATPAGEPVYNKWGFKPELKLERLFTRSLAGSEVSLHPGDLLRIQKSDLPEIVRYDGRVFGADRTELIHYLVGQQPERCWIIREAGSVVASLFVRRGTLYNHMGPLHAQTVGQAKALVSRVARDLNGQPAILDILEDKTALRSWVSELGFSPQRPLCRMFRGGNPFPGILKFQYAICGPELG